MIYLDHAATTPIKREVFEAMLPYYTDSFANASSTYAAGRANKRAIDSARKQVAELIGANPKEIYFTSGGSESNNWALKAAVQKDAFKSTHIITTKIEHHSVLRTCEALENKGVRITYLDVDSRGCVSPENVQAAMCEQTALVSVMLANNEVGTIQAIREISEIAHRFGILIHTDAVQAVGHIPIDVNELDVDFMSMSGHKFYGPKGIGSLYVRKNTRFEPLIYGGAQEQGMRAGTENTPSIVGFGAAAALAKKTMEQHSTYIKRLRDHMSDLAVQRIPGVRINGLGANRLPGHLHMSIPDVNADLILMQLDFSGIAASSGSACASGSSEKSHVLTAMGCGSENWADVRFSIGECNTEEEIEQTISVLEGIVRKLRGNA